MCKVSLHNTPERILQMPNHISTMDHERKKLVSTISEEEAAQEVCVNKGLLFLSILLNSFLITGSFYVRNSFSFEAFEEVGISSNLAGLIESSMLAGNLIFHFTGASVWFMTRLSTRAVMCACSTTEVLCLLSNGFLLLIPSNVCMVVVGVIVRVVQGAVNLVINILIIDMLHTFYPDRYDILLGVIGATQYAGVALCTSAGALVYDGYGYMPAFLLMAGLVVSADLSALLWVPAVPTYCARMATQEDKKEEGGEKEEGISPFALLPLCACCLINFVWGFIQLALTPYLHDTFALSFTTIGAIVALAAPGSVLGCMILGALLQVRWISASTQMTISIVMMGVAIFLTFPSANFTLLFDVVPKTAYLSMLLMGFADPLVTYAAIDMMGDVQRKACGKLTPRSTAVLASTWACWYGFFYFTAGAAAGILKGLVEYSVVGMGLVGLCLLSLTFCLTTKIVIAKLEKRGYSPI